MKEGTSLPLDVSSLLQEERALSLQEIICTSHNWAVRPLEEASPRLKWQGETNGPAELLHSTKTMSLVYQLQSPGEPLATEGKDPGFDCLFKDLTLNPHGIAVLVCFASKMQVLRSLKDCCP